MGDSALKLIEVGVFLISSLFASHEATTQPVIEPSLAVVNTVVVTEQIRVQVPTSSAASATVVTDSQ